ncbi:ATPase [Longimycelium tulufanense]|uniref:ATPase n=1 Tax=Longimycelium tulufanense TaxID=907463 RepID=A0A8J3FZ65_9PSEU|nr:ATP/GTP-binding protein [Longimycelium tulufanense]GGM81965.1 ATPase [Longimycelium tulufanense]
MIRRPPTARGIPGPGGGRDNYIPVPTEYRGTTVQVCGLWPFSAGSGSPMIGVPLGRHLITGASVCFDPISFFRAGLISNPGMFVLGLPGLGKSTLLRRLVLGLTGYGVRPLVLGDLKPDYADLVAALGGQVVRLGRGMGSINPLDTGALGQAAAQMSGAAAEQLGAEIQGRRLNMVAALITIIRGHRVSDHETVILSTALRALASRHEGTPVLPDLVKLLDDGPPEVRAVTLDRGDDARYREAVDPLHRSLLALLDGPLGETFARPTTTHIDLEAPAVCVDVSRIGESDEQLQAAALLTTWSAGFGAVAGAQALTDAGLAPRRNYFLVMDELWRVLRSGAGLVDRVDAVTRLNRNDGYGSAMCTHTLNDLRALPTEEDRQKARGLAERCAVTVTAGLPTSELALLRDMVDFHEEEARLVTSWSAPAPWDSVYGQQAAPPGLGKALIKVGGKPGIPLKVQLTPEELALNDTNRRWQMAGRGQA